MRISFAGGAEYFNCDKLFAAGIWPITVATTILKPGGYNRLLQMVEKVEPMPYKPFDGTDTQAICDMSTASHTDVHHVKPIKPLPSRKSEKNVPWIDCFTAPCKGGCPIAQDIPEYMELCNKGLYGPALKLITEKIRLFRPAPSAPIAVRPSAPATSMIVSSASATPSCWPPRRATTP